MPELEPTISLGNILTMLTTVASVIIGAGSIIYKLSRQEHRLNLMWEDFKKKKRLID